MTKSIDEMADKMIANLEAKTGSSLAEWIQRVEKSGIKKHKEIINYLKAEHDFTYGFANMVALKARESWEGSPAQGDDLIDAQYAGSKADLRPIYDSLIKAMRKFGDDLEVSPKKAYVSLRRNKQFAILQPSTKTRLDVGINLKGKGSTERLEESGSFNAMVSHRVRLTEQEQIDDELIGWLREAYEAA
jgi:hypothetical protein